MADREVVPAGLLVSVERSGGLVLGAYDGERDSARLVGCLVDLAAHYQGHPAQLTLQHLVHKEARNRGIGHALRVREREECRRQGVGVVTWGVDPLRSVEAHFAFTKLRAVGVAYERATQGERAEPGRRTLASDRVAVEWWVESPRVCAFLDRATPPRHLRVGLDRMDVVTKTTLTESGLRRLVGFTAQPRSDLALVEIPTDLDALWQIDPDLACDWRLKTRECFETLTLGGYVVSGFVHEAGRSFHLLERAPRDAFLKRAF